MYEYRARMRRAIDGDTVALDVDLGFSVHTLQSIRLIGVDAPEVVGESKAAGLDARAYVDSIAPRGTGVVLRTQKDARSFNRYLGRVELPGGIDLAAEIIAAGHGVRA